MKAMSAELVRGEIDQVSEHFTLTWVRPRILNRDQVSGLTGLLDVWCKDVHTIEKDVEKAGHELILAN